jgi:crotonobetainyl-CoA:carnitine CoA-transferase CaiB-like acyl-CoA transferase
MVNELFSDRDTPQGGPLAGLRVVEQGSVVMASFAGQLLGDMGATVVKVEPPGGELIRSPSLGGPNRHPGMGAMFLNTNKNKRDVVYNLKDKQEKELFFELLEDADVFITNQRPHSRVKLGLDYDSIHEKFPQLVYCAAQGFRKESKEYDQAAYDEIIQSAAGLTSAMEYLTGHPSCFPTMAADKICGLVIVNSVLAAVYARNHTGKGQEVNIPMVDTMVAFIMIEHLWGNTFVPSTEAGGGFPTSFTAGHGDVRAKNGNISMHPYTLQNMKDLLAAANKLEILDSDKYFQDWRPDADGRQHLYEVLLEIAPTRTVEEWKTVCEEHNIPMSIPLDIKKPLDNAYVRDGDVLREFDHSTEGRILIPRYPVYFGETPIDEYEEAPNLAKSP